MPTNVVAYVGTESFDIIIYLSCILQKLNRKVLIVDNSVTSALRNSIPQVYGINTDKTIMTYKRVDFTTQVIDKAIINNYDDVLIDFGFSEPKMDLSLITRVVYVTDMFDFHVTMLKNIGFYNGIAKKALLIRDAIETKITPNIIAGRINEEIPKEEVSVLYREDKDYENSIVCHYNRSFRMKSISSMLKMYLLNEIQILCSNINSKQIRVAFNKARKGE